MSIELGYVAECDACDIKDVGYYDTLGEFVFYLKSQGWSTHKLESFEEPLCYCEDCTKEGYNHHLKEGR